MIGHAIHHDLIACDGTVVETLAASNFRVMLEGGQLVTCRPCGKMRLNKIMIVCGDRVVVEMPACAGGMERGRLIFRYTGEERVQKPRGRRVRREGRARKGAAVLTVSDMS
jgi:translation initiation factor IF-1